MTTVFNRLGPYEILESVGSGGMAHVFLALDTRSNDRVALRLVPLGRDHEAREIAAAERLGAALQAQFSSSCVLVPRVYEHGELPEYFYVAMEYLDGENLSDAIARGRIPPERAVAIAIELCSFLETAHRFETVIDGRPLRSLLHGDLKPRNVRITSAGCVKVLDFGMAKALSLSRKVTRTDFGTLGYMSPERLESGELDAHADFWALGVILHQMVSGAPPFAAPDTHRLERLITSRRPPPSLDGLCPAGLQAILARMLAPRPDERYPSATAIREDLLCYQAGRETEAQRDGWPARMDEPPTQRTHRVETALNPPDPPNSDEAPTQRTRPPAPPAATPDAVEQPGDRPMTAAAPRRSRTRWVRTGLMMLALLLVANEFVVANAARRAVFAAVTRDLGDIGGLWNEYETLARRSYLGIGVAGLERALTERTQDLADRVIANYRMPTSSVREAQWLAARDGLQRALSVRPGNARLKASLRYCEGHLHRINGDARKARRQVAAARHEFTEAVAAFREAAELRSEWPDPFLGLVRTFIYGLEDIDRGADALKQAERLGFSPGDRETIQLADGYRVRGDMLWRTADELADMPQEEEHLRRAAESFREALTLYGRVLAVPGTAVNMRRAQRALEQVEARLLELTEVRKVGLRVRTPAHESQPFGPPQEPWP